MIHFDVRVLLCRIEHEHHWTHIWPVLGVKWILVFPNFIQIFSPGNYSVTEIMISYLSLLDRLNDWNQNQNWVSWRQKLRNKVRNRYLVLLFLPEKDLRRKLHVCEEKHSVIYEDNCKLLPPPPHLDQQRLNCFKSLKQNKEQGSRVSRRQLITKSARVSVSTWPDYSLVALLGFTSLLRDWLTGELEVTASTCTYLRTLLRIRKQTANVQFLSASQAGFGSSSWITKVNEKVCNKF